jgi:putative transcriptional regulator
MRDDLFDELITSLREAGAIHRGEAPPSRSYGMEEADSKQIRQDLQLSQREFASLLGISLGTLRNWEQGRRTPEGPAKVLLQIVARHPEVLLDLAVEEKSVNIDVTASNVVNKSAESDFILIPNWPKPNSHQRGRVISVDTLTQHSTLQG